MKVAASAFSLLLSIAFACGCNKNDQAVPISASAPQGMSRTPAASAPAAVSDSDLVKQAVEDHVRSNKGVNMSAMDVTVDSVNIDGDHAQANATFRVKGGDASMEMVYSLERQSAGWQVTQSQPANGQYVHPPLDKTGSSDAGPSAPASSGTPDFTGFLRNQPAQKSN